MRPKLESETGSDERVVQDGKATRGIPAALVTAGQEAGSASAPV